MLGRLGEMPSEKHLQVHWGVRWIGRVAPTGRVDLERKQLSF